MSLFKKKSGLKIENVTLKLNETNLKMSSMFNKKQAKEIFKRSKSLNYTSVTYLINFKGNVIASQVNSLAKEIDAILLSSSKGDEVLLSLESPGGTVTGYGLVAEQICRLKDAGLKVVAVVDQVAASGGYMIACVADEIVVAKRAVIGSIGVVVGMPNYEDVLKKIGIEYKFYTAGEKKRGVTQYQTPDETQVEDLENHLKEIHEEFKAHIKEYRPDIDIETLSTGETWSGLKSVELGLADRLGITDTEIFNRYRKGAMILKVSYDHPKPKKGFLSRQMSSITSSVIDTVMDKISSQIQNKAVNRF